MTTEPKTSQFAVRLNMAWGGCVMSNQVVKVRQQDLDTIVVVSVRTDIQRVDMVVMRRDFAVKFLREAGNHAQANDVERSKGDVSRVTFLRSINEDVMVIDTEIATAQHLGMSLGLAIGTA